MLEKQCTCSPLLETLGRGLDLIWPEARAGKAGTVPSQQEQAGSLSVPSIPFSAKTSRMVSLQHMLIEANGYDLHNLYHLQAEKWDGDWNNISPKIFIYSCMKLLKKEAL